MGRSTRPRRNVTAPRRRCPRPTPPCWRPRPPSSRRHDGPHSSPAMPSSEAARPGFMTTTAPSLRPPSCNQRPQGVSNRHTWPGMNETRPPPRYRLHDKHKLSSIHALRATSLCPPCTVPHRTPVLHIVADLSPSLSTPTSSCSFSPRKTLYNNNHHLL